MPAKPQPQAGSVARCRNVNSRKKQIPQSTVAGRRRAKQLAKAPVAAESSYSSSDQEVSSEHPRQQSFDTAVETRPAWQARK